MAREWKMLFVEEVAAHSPNAIVTGPFGSSISSRFFRSVGIPVIRGSNLTQAVGERLKDEGLVFLTPEKAAEFSRSVARRGDLVFTCWGTIGQVGLIDQRSRYDEYIISNKQMKLTPDPARFDSLFLYYAFSSPAVSEEIKNQSIGSSVPGFNLGQLKGVRLRVPPLATQRAIARILGALDDKIELNRKMNATLEAMARALFKSWFVDFDPVRAKAEGRAPSGMDADTAKLFPSEFVDSELGPIPKGWRAGSVGDVIEVHDSRRVALSSRERQQRRGTFPYYGATSVMDYVDAFLFHGRFVLVGEDGSVVTPEGLPFTQYVWGRFWVNNHAHVLTGIRGVSPEHLYLLFQQTNIAAYVTGAVQAKLSQGNMRKIPLVVAPDAINVKFASLVDLLFARFRGVTEEAQTLARIRDELLPRLLSGELSVNAIEAL